MKPQLDTIQKEIKEIKKVLDDIKKLITNPSYSGKIEYGNAYHQSRTSKQITLDLYTTDE